MEVTAQLSSPVIGDLFKFSTAAEKERETVTPHTAVAAHGYQLYTQVTPGTL